MTFWVAGTVAASALVGAYSSNKAAKAQANAAQQATDVQERMFNKQVELQEPWRQAGVNALAKLQSGNIDMYQDPSYKFRLSEGLKALDRQAAARGGLISGGALKAAQRYGQDVASQEYGSIWNRLASQAGLGQTATNQLGSAAGAYGANVGNLMTSGAAARASGYMGGANALAQGMGQYLNYSQNQNMLNAFMNRPTGPYAYQQGPSIYADASQIPMQPGGGY